EYIKIKVNDTGCGIPKQIIKKVFDPFFTTKQEGKGTGLGLSVVYGTVKDHNGFISIDSEEGKGTEITIAIPVAKPEKTKQEEILQEEISEGGTILIADDEDLIRNTLERILKSLSYSVITASEGSEAIEIIRQNANRIDAVFLDLIMPKMSGAEVLQKIREIDKQLPVIIISGFSTLSSFDEAINMGANAFLQKPFKKEDVIKTLTKIQHKGIK
ncbi:MAG TPA: response regulator, partial [Spirochaetota bacterium]|nr:response regulator [Spirochaetota bacterium]